MPASLQANHVVSHYYAPRGRKRMFDLGSRIAQLYLNPDDRLIGIMGSPGCGKSSLVKGMFPGLELTNDDEGVNIRPLPLLSIDEEFGFFSPHTYHVDIRFETGFTQLSVLADAIMAAVNKGKRVVVEHFELVYPMLPINANLLIGIGEDIIITRPGLFGPEPDSIIGEIQASLPYRLMAHSAEDLCEFCMDPADTARCSHGDVHHGFILSFPENPPAIDPAELERKVQAMIAQDLPITYKNENHITIGGDLHYCTGPRTHVNSTGKIRGFHLLPNYVYDRFQRKYLLVGCVGEDSEENLSKLEKMSLLEASPYEM